MYLDDAPVEPEQARRPAQEQDGRRTRLQGRHEGRYQGALRHHRQGAWTPPTPPASPISPPSPDPTQRERRRHDPRNRPLRRPGAPRQGPRSRRDHPGRSARSSTISSTPCAHARGVGLAAQQIGEAIQLAVIDITGIKERPSKMWIDGKPVDPEEHMPLMLIDPVLKPTKTQDHQPRRLPQLPRPHPRHRPRPAGLRQDPHARRRHLRIRCRRPARPRRSA